MQEPKPVGDRLLVLRREKTSQLGIIMPDSYKKSDTVGTVISCGSKCKCSPGDTVVYKGTGVDVSDIFGENHIVLREGIDVLLYQNSKDNGVQ